MASKADLASVVAGNAELAENRVFGVALVGLGRSGHFHLTSIKALSHATKLKWAIDINPESAKKIAKDHGCKCSTQLSDALEDAEVDVVIIASTTDTHFPFIMKSLQAKKSVFAEKPISHE